jgi:NADP-dependent 3-hydroxy acid dehydrogenase YdfG
MRRIFIAGASSGIGLAIAAHKNGHNAFDKRGGIALEEAESAAPVMIARSASPKSETGKASQGRSQQR